MTKTGVGVHVLGGHGFVIRKARASISLAVSNMKDICVMRDRVASIVPGL